MPKLAVDSDQRRELLILLEKLREERLVFILDQAA